MENKRIFNLRSVCWGGGEGKGAWVLGRDWSVELAVDVKGTEKKSPLMPSRPEGAFTVVHRLGAGWRPSLRSSLLGCKTQKTTR